MKLFSLCLVALLLATAICDDAKKPKDEKFEFALNLKGGVGAKTGLEDLIDGFKQSALIKDMFADVDLSVIKETMEHIIDFLQLAKDEVEGFSDLEVPKFQNIKGKLLKMLNPF
uniref:Venom peptide n=1 Tax=Panagrellus redivivus TaxID=6233 RepID=A0A7E4UWI4_PANRE